MQPSCTECAVPLQREIKKTAKIWHILIYMNTIVSLAHMSTSIITNTRHMSTTTSTNLMSTIMSIR